MTEAKDRKRKKIGRDKKKKEKARRKAAVFAAVLFVLLQSEPVRALALAGSEEKNFAIMEAEKEEAENKVKKEEGTTEDKGKEEEGITEDKGKEEGTTQDKEKEEATTEVIEKIRITAEGMQGSILLDGEEEKELQLEKGSMVRVTVISEKGYAAEHIYINGEEWIGKFSCNNEKKLEFFLENITQDQEIKVTFQEIPEVSRNQVWFDKDYISQREQTYIYKKDKEVYFYTDMAGIRLYKDGEKSSFAESIRKEEGLDKKMMKKESVSKKNARKIGASVSIFESNKITGIEVYGKIGCQYVWQKVTGVSENSYIYIVIDGIAPKIQIAHKGEQGIPYAREDIEVTITVEDLIPYSGIRRIQYWVEKDGDSEHPSQKETLYDSNNISISDEKDCKEMWNGKVVVNVQLNNSCNVALFVRATDYAGNERIESMDLDMDCSAPQIAISYDNNTDNNGNTYFNAQRRATVVFTERTHHFNKEKATAGIQITAKDARGNAVEEAYTISEWNTVEGKTPDEAIHTATISFEKDANYTLEISYTDEAGNKNSEVKTGNSKAPFRFTVDTTAPVGAITAESEEGRKVTWKKLRDTLTFGFWSKKKITISAVAEDATSSSIAKVEYYKVQSENGIDNTTVLTCAQLEQVIGWKDFTVSEEKKTKKQGAAFSGSKEDQESEKEDTYQFEVKANQHFVVYLKITDLAGNYTYISTNGLIVDHQAPMEEVIAPAVTINPGQPVNGIYNRDVKVAVTVKDPLAGGAYSGLKKVTYEIRNMGKTTQTGTLYQFEMEEPKQADLKQSWSGEIVVDSKKNNSNDVEIIVYGQDNALNDSEDSRKIKIDVTAPKIRISYNNNNVDSDKYFKENRTATITVTERNFNAQDVITTIKNTEGFVPKVSAWKKGKGTGNGDDTTWIATVKYTKDGDYTFGIQYTDLAGNRAKDIGFAEGTAAGKAFTIDKTIPTFTVTYDNNAAQNGNYYKASRTAIIRVTEHNFDASCVIPKITASDNGKNVGIPGISAWKHKGDVHTATITYNADALYTFDISMKDKAGNETKDYAEEKFYVDKTMPKLTITGVKNNSANTGDVIPVVSFSDTNFDPEHSTITLTGANRGNVKLEGSYSNGENGRIFVFKNFAKEKEVDDIYTLLASTTDKAGNLVKQKVTFSVNRFGSTYEFGKHLKIINGTYVKAVKDIVLTEINPDALKNVEITLFKNNETMLLEEENDYKIQVSGGNGEWHRYKYTIFKENFVENGVYRITVSSEDAAGNVAENTLDTKNMEIGFGVDTEKPLLNITNLEDGHTYPVENLNVLMTASDNLVFTNLLVYLDGQEVPYQEWTAEEVAEILSGKGEFTFTIAGDTKEAHRVKVVAKDAAGNEEIKEAKDFYVTTDLWIRFFNNKPLFYGSMAAVVLLLGLVLFLLLKKKKEEEKEA